MKRKGDLLAQLQMEQQEMEAKKALEEAENVRTPDKLRIAFKIHYFLLHYQRPVYFICYY